MKQTTSRLMMIRPEAFQYNAQTAISNSFQNSITNLSKHQILKEAQREYDDMVNDLIMKNINVDVFLDTEEPTKPDAIFPNNWITMSQEGILTLYPMKNKNRRLERRKDIIELLETNFIINRKIDLSEYENQDRALEGTGSIVFNHISKKAYACLSARTDEEILRNYCKQINYEPVVFYAYDSKGQPIYHTNVVMNIGTGYVVIGMGTIKREKDYQLLKDNFEEDNLEIIELTDDQLLNSFAGNMLEVQNLEHDPFLVMSKRAFNSLDKTQIKNIEKYTSLLPVSIDLIETIGGGSARCMIAEIFFEKK